MSLIRRRLGPVVAVLVALSSVLVAGMSVASAATGDVRLTIESDGTPSFDGDNDPGHDDGPNNGRVRTQDSVTLRMEWSINDQNVRLVSVLPPDSGLGWDTRLPNVCRTGSSVSSDGLTLTCALGDRSEGANGAVLGTVLVGAKLTDGETFDTSFTLSGDSTPVVASNSVGVQVTSAPNVDFSKQGFDAPLFQGQTNAAGESGFVFLWPVTAQVGGSGRGAEDITGTVTVTDDVTGISPNTEVYTEPLDIGVGDPISTCGPNSFTSGSTPLGAIGISEQAVPGNSVTDSGAWTCTQPGGPRYRRYRRHR